MHNKATTAHSQHCKDENAIGLPLLTKASPGQPFAKQCLLTTEARGMRKLVWLVCWAGESLGKLSTNFQTKLTMERESLILRAPQGSYTKYSLSIGTCP